MSSDTLHLGEVFEFVTGVACPLTFAVMVSCLLGLFVFGPLYAKATWTPPRMHYRIADILVLLVQLQLSAGLLFALLPMLDPMPTAIRVAVAGLVWMMQTLWWFLGVRMLAKARVQRGADRLLFLSIILPLGYLATFGIMASPVVVVALAGFAIWAMNQPGWDQVGVILLLSFSLAAPYGITYGIRRFCEFLVDHARDDYAYIEGIAFEKLHVHKMAPRTAATPASEQDVRIVDP